MQADCRSIWLTCVSCGRDSGIVAYPEALAHELHEAGVLRINHLGLLTAPCGVCETCLSIAATGDGYRALDGAAWQDRLLDALRIN